MAKISVIGCEWVGLTVAAGMAHLGHDVVAYDTAGRTFAELQGDILANGEERTCAFIEKHAPTRRLRFAMGVQEAVADAEMHFVCDPVSISGDGGDDAALDQTIEEMLGVVADGSIIVLTSTVSVGTADRVRARLGAPWAPQKGVAVVSCPVFMRQSSAIADFLRPEQVVLGAEDPLAAQRVAALFGCVAERLLFMSNRSAETLALASGAFEALATSFVNSMAGLCEAIDADIDDVARALVGQLPAATTFRPGPGWGGERLTSEVAALTSLANQHGASTTLLDAVIESNRERIDHVSNAVLRQLGPLGVDAAGRRSATVAVWGLGRSSGNAGRRDSPAMAVVDRLLECGLDVQAFDPAVTGPLIERLDVTVHTHPYAAAAGADVLLILSDWESFADLDLAHAAECMARQRVVDARRILVADELGQTQPAVEVLR